MGDETKIEIIQLVTDKLDEIRKEFEAEGKLRRKLMTRFLIGFSVLAFTFIFSAGVIVQKVNSLEINSYKVADKVEILYLVAVAKGDINLDIITRGESN